MPGVAAVPYSKEMETTANSDATQHLSEGARFLARLEPFRDLHHEHLERVATAMAQRFVAAGATVLVEGGAPGTELYIVKSRTAPS